MNCQYDIITFTSLSFLTQVYVARRTYESIFYLKRHWLKKVKTELGLRVNVGVR